MRNRIRKFSLIALLPILGILFIAKMTDIPFIGIKYKESPVWSIGIYKFSDDGIVKRVSPHPQAKNPVLTAKDITDRKAKFVADPFLVYEDSIYYMFFEVLSDDKGDIGLAMSKDGISWKYQKIVLDEPFHLSYPCAFKWKNDYYMIPESSEDKSVRLYKSENFPYEWRFEKNLLEGEAYTDPTIFYYQDKWWLFVSTVFNDVLYLYYADDVTGPWIEHPESPVVRRNSNIARCGGSIIHLDGKLIRITQDCLPSYGNSVRAFKITELDAQKYTEKELEESPLLTGSGEGWNKDGMHHLSLLPMDKREGIASVDGNRFNEKKYNLYVELPDFLGKFLEYVVKQHANAQGGSRVHEFTR